MIRKLNYYINMRNRCIIDLLLFIDVHNIIVLVLLDIT